MRFISDTLLRLYCWAKEETAQTMAEYGLILALISVAAVAVLLLLGPQIAAVFTNIKDTLANSLT
jgi:pilus assembly protein Flp/PilA